LQHIVQGKANKAIAWELRNSVRPIETHRANLMSELRIKSVADLVRLTTLPR
jgi:two-component system response regulator FixJ